MKTEYKSVTELAAENPNLQEYLTQLEHEYLRYKTELKSLMDTFRHTHKNNGLAGDDSCAWCGLDLRHEIHTRINQTVTAIPNEKS